MVQIQRMVHRGRYADGTATPDGPQFDIADGERSILDQYRSAIDAACSSIYIENQALPIPEISARLEAALRRGVDVVLLVPARSVEHARSAHRNPANDALLAGVEALWRHDNFLLSGLAVSDGLARRREIHVHAKAMLVDDAWATVGSCNLHSNSLSGHTEMNASVWDGGVVSALRCGLLLEHLGEDTTHLDDRAALQRYRQIARANALGERSGDPDRQGSVLALETAM